MTLKAAGNLDPTKTLSVPDAGKKYFDLAPDAAYAAARRGEIPTIRIGGRIRAVVPAIEQMLQTAGKRTLAA
jgi:hypothetical protein